MEKNGIWIESFDVTASMVNAFGEVTLTSVCHKIQEAAGNHAAFHELGYFDMVQNELFWALSRLKISIDKYPPWNESVQIQTWVESMKGPFSFRYFLLSDHQDAPIGSASTLWTAVNAQTRKVTSVEGSKFPIVHKTTVPCGSTIKIQVKPEKTNPVTWKVGFSDLDMIKHVNNVKYIEHLLNTYDWSKKTSGPRQLEINYLSEAFLDDTLHIYSQSDESGTLHLIQCPAKKKEIVRARIEW